MEVHIGAVDMDEWEEELIERAMVSGVGLLPAAVVNLSPPLPIESAAYCFMSSVSDDDHVMWSGKVAQCLSQVGKEEAQDLTVLNSDENVWYFDSGASHHMIQPRVHVVNKRKLEYPMCINIAKRSLVMHAYEQGDVIVRSKVKGSIHKIHLQECLRQGLEV
jgi:hypothetical protein